MRGRFAAWLRKLAARLDGKIFVEVLVPTNPTALDDGDSQLAFARREIGKWQLRAALRRYSPDEKPGQC